MTHRAGALFRFEILFSIQKMNLAGERKYRVCFFDKMLTLQVSMKWTPTLASTASYSRCPAPLACMPLHAREIILSATATQLSRRRQACYAGRFLSFRITARSNHALPQGLGVEVCRTRYAGKQTLLVGSKLVSKICRYLHIEIKLYYNTKNKCRINVTYTYFVQ